ncbi:response regulator transcription factor [Alloalcanivorax sp. C16-2]|uniref:response regulator transcription factor n=1 Tax=Alloalcanivorax TaxID=3020832 RepID=UPI001931D099|nr:response regulator transcription factor [Alloalcanivorax marinus]MBL7251268.1 response regulator transcription factor [Alloalcanivorax marinus]
MNALTHCPARLLVIEDDPVLSADLRAYFSDRHHQVTVRRDGRSGLAAARDQRFDLVMLDILLPGLDGLALLAELRRHSPVPVILLSALGDEQDRITGLVRGADDYLPKPFSMAELAVRVEAVLRRVALERRAPTVRNAGGLRLDPATESARYQDRDLALTVTEFRLLQVLADQPDQVLSKAFLYQTVLHRGFGRHDRSLDLHVSHLRRKLRDAGIAGQPLRTVWGQGYTLVTEGL